MSMLDYIKGHLELPYRPFRIGADAVTILSNATRAVKHIFDHRAAMDARGLHNVPLIVSNGEDHSYVSNKAHHMLVVSEVMKRETIAVAIEMYHNYFYKKLNNAGYSDFVEEIKARDIEEGGALSLKAHVTMNVDHRTPFSTFVFNNMLLRHKIKTCFCDVAGASDPYRSIDKTDPSSLDSLRFFFGDDLPDSVDLIEHGGVVVRSHHMANMTMNFAKQSNARIVFLQCGDGHVIGWEDEDFEAKDGTKFLGKDFGLNHFFRRLATPSVGLVLNGIKVLRKDTEWKDETIFVGKDMPEISATYNPVTGRSRKEDVTSDIHSEAAEAVYLNAILSRTGLSSETVTLENKREIQTEYNAELRSMIDLISGGRAPILA